MKLIITSAQELGMKIRYLNHKESLYVGSVILVNLIYYTSY